MASVQFQNISKTYNNKQYILKDINLDIQDKEFIVFVGPSGCGKSTTLRLIAGLEEITSGALYIDGVLANDIPSAKRDIAMVFQNYALYPHMSIAQNLGFALKMAKVDKNIIAKKVKQVANMLGLSEFLNEKPKSLSGGQKQRVALGRAMVRNPKVFLFDEPLSNLDSKLRVNMRTEIVKFHKKLNATFIYVTHDQIEAMTMGSRIVVLNKGIIEQVDTPKNLYKNPSNTFVAEFIGSPKMNLFNAKLLKNNEKYFIEFKSYKKEIPSNFHLKTDILDFAHEDVEVLLGIRAENIYSGQKEGLDFYFETKVSTIEDIGSDVYIYFYDNKDKMVARISDISEYSSQNKIKLGFFIHDIHIFLKKSKETIIKKDL